MHAMFPTPVISTHQLAELMADPHVKLVDGTWYLPPTTANAQEDYVREHLAGAVFFDIDAVSDPSTALPHMLPSPEQFAKAVGQMGIGNDDFVVVYDRQGLFSAPRVWWMFRVFGHQHVAVLDGGLPKWLAEGRPVTDTPVLPVSKTFIPQFQPQWVRSSEEVLNLLAQPGAQILDMRPLGRYLGQDPEPRPGLRSGHIPGSVSAPWSLFIRPEDKTLLDTASIQALMLERDVNAEQPVTCYCGSGVTACVAALALTAAGAVSVSVYDGSWAEWGGDTRFPLEA